MLDALHCDSRVTSIVDGGQYNFSHGYVNGIGFSWLSPNLSQTVWKRIGMTRIIYQLFEGHEYAKLGLDEKDFSQAWDFWNHSSHLL
jgi:hypothetical protein